MADEVHEVAASPSAVFSSYSDNFLVTGVEVQIVDGSGRHPFPVRHPILLDTDNIAMSTPNPEDEDPTVGRSHFRNHQSMADNLECRNACDHTARGEKPHSKRDPAVWGAKSCHGMMDVIRHAVSPTTLKRHVDNGFCTFENYHEITVFAAWAAPGTFNSVGLMGYVASGFIAETVHPFDNKTFDLSKETAVADMLRWAASLEEA